MLAGAFMVWYNTSTGIILLLSKRAWETMPSKGERRRQVMNYSEALRIGYNGGCADAGRAIKELEDKIRDTEKVLYSLSVGNGIPPRFSVGYDYYNHRCKVYKRTRPEIDKDCFGGKEVVFTKAELLEAIENIQKDSVT